MIYFFVGFISELPHELVESFKSTLQEVLDSDLLLHIQDVSSTQHLQEKSDVIEVLTSIKANHIPTINVLNKIDLLDIEADKFIGEGTKVSAETKQGIEELLVEIEKSLELNYEPYDLMVDIQDFETMNYLYKHGKNLNIIEEDIQNDCLEYKINVELKKENYNYYLKSLKK